MMPWKNTVRKRAASLVAPQLHLCSGRSWIGSARITGDGTPQRRLCPVSIGLADLKIRSQQRQQRAQQFRFLQQFLRQTIESLEGRQKRHVRQHVQWKLAIAKLRRREGRHDQVQRFASFPAQAPSQLERYQCTHAMTEKGERQVERTPEIFSERIQDL